MLAEEIPWGLVLGHKNPQLAVRHGCQKGLPRSDVHLRLTTGVTEVTHLPPGLLLWGKKQHEPRPERRHRLVLQSQAISHKETK